MTPFSTMVNGKWGHAEVWDADRKCEQAEINCQVYSNSGVKHRLGK